MRHAACGPWQLPCQTFEHPGEDTGSGRLLGAREGPPAVTTAGRPGSVPQAGCGRVRNAWNTARGLTPEKPRRGGRRARRISP